MDQRGINVTLHKGLVVSEVGRRNVHRVVASEKGKNHTIIECGSASGHAILYRYLKRKSEDKLPDPRGPLSRKVPSASIASASETRDPGSGASERS